MTKAEIEKLLAENTALKAQVEKPAPAVASAASRGRKPRAQKMEPRMFAGKVETFGNDKTKGLIAPCADGLNPRGRTLSYKDGSGDFSMVSGAITLAASRAWIDMLRCFADVPAGSVALALERKVEEIRAQLPERARSVGEVRDWE